MQFILLAAAIAGGLVVDERLADVVYPPAQQTPPAAVKNCRDGCTCPKEICRCGDARATACTEDEPLAVTFDESKLQTVAAQAQEQTDTITVLVPEWCVIPCETFKQLLGNGDALTKVDYVAKEAWWELGPDESYPMMVNLKTLRKWSVDTRKDPQGNTRPKNMDEARAKLGIVPKAKGHAVGLTVGTVPKAQVDLLRTVLGESGRRVQGKEPLTREIHGAQSIIPAHAVCEWKTVAGVLTLNFDKRPRVILGGIVNQDLDRIVITDKTVTLVLPWAPDVTWQIVE